jgi:hypothetical protein
MRWNEYNNAYSIYTLMSNKYLTAYPPQHHHYRAHHHHHRHSHHYLHPCQMWHSQQHHAAVNTTNCAYCMDGDTMLHVRDLHRSMDSRIRDVSSCALQRMPVVEVIWIHKGFINNQHTSACFLCKSCTCRVKCLPLAYCLKQMRHSICFFGSAETW